MPHIVKAARSEPAKVLALKTGISAREITDLREGRHLPSVPTFMLLAMHDPELRAHAVAIMSGAAEHTSPQAINRLVRHFTNYIS